MRLPRTLLVGALFGVLTTLAEAAIDPAPLKPLAGDDPDARIEAVSQIAVLATPDALQLLNALKADALYAAPDGQVYIADGENGLNPATSKTEPLPDGVDGVTVNNRLRLAVEDALSGLRLLSPDRTVRLTAAMEMQKPRPRRSRR